MLTGIQRRIYTDASKFKHSGAIGFIYSDKKITTFSGYKFSENIPVYKLEELAIILADQYRKNLDYADSIPILSDSETAITLLNSKINNIKKIKSHSRVLGNEMADLLCKYYNANRTSFQIDDFIIIIHNSPESDKCQIR